MSIVTLKVPDIGGAEDAEVIELLVGIGDEVDSGQGLLVLESDKASMEIPAETPGVIKEVFVSIGDLLSEGSKIAAIESAAKDSVNNKEDGNRKISEVGDIEKNDKAEIYNDKNVQTVNIEQSSAKEMDNNEDRSSFLDEQEKENMVYAGPAVRKLARQFGIVLAEISGTGPGGRIVKEDLHGFVKRNLSTTEAASTLLEYADIDFSKWGEVERVTRNKVEVLTAENMHRSWTNVPHVTQFDDADITDLEAFRAELKEESERRKTKLTLMPFLLKALAVQLRDHPNFNASLTDSGKVLVKKQYINIGMAVDTPHGLFVPVIRDVDRKTLWELAHEVAELAIKARNRDLRPGDMQGGCFTISSLGKIGGSGFTPIINTPELAILGVGRSEIRPVWDGTSFNPHTLLPLSLSYDHRAINGGEAARFCSGLAAIMTDIRKLIL